MTKRRGRFPELWAHINPSLGFMFAATLFLGLYKTVSQIVVGPGWDTYSFLANGAAIAGRGYGYVEPARPPLISVVSAPFLALGFMSPATVQLVDFLFVLIALAGVYLLARRRMGSMVAAGAALGVLISTPLWEWIGVGYSDLGGVALCIWALLAVIKATETDPRYYSAAFSLLVLAALMRTTSLLFIFPFAVWMLMRTRFFPHARYIILGMLAAAVVYLPFGIYYGVAIGDALYPFVASLRIQRSASLGVGVISEIGSYLGALPILAAPPSVVVLTLLVLLVAVAALVWAVIRSLRMRGVTVGRIVAASAVVPLAALLAVRGGLASSQLAILGGVYFTWRLLGSDEHSAEGGRHRVIPADRALDATVVAWLLCYFVFHESWPQKVTRYYIMMAPQVAYLVALGWSEIARAMPAYRPAHDAKPTLAQTLRDPLPLARRLVWVPLLLLLAGGAAVDVVTTSWTPNETVMDARKTAEFLQARPGVGGSVVYSDMWPVTAWYLKQNVIAMPTFSNASAVEHELQKNQATYYVTLHDITPAHYRAIYSTDDARVLASNGKRNTLPEVLYLGSGWENYLEELSGFRINVTHKEGDYNMEGSAFYDAYPLSELQKYSAVAVFGGIWHNRGAAERLLQSYVEQGGTLVLDASGNLTDPTSLGNTVLFDTIITRQLVPADSRIQVVPTFAAARATGTSFTPSPWITETNERWYGAGYDALPGSEPLTVLARLGGRPLIAERRWGRGRVIWMAYNLPWHAKITENASEARLLSAVLDEAIGATGK